MKGTAKSPCKIDRCNYPQAARELCESHYYKHKRAGTLDEISPNPSTTCGHCGQSIPSNRRWGAEFCSTDCKQASRDAAHRVARTEQRRTANRACAWCREPLAAERPFNTRFCNEKCGDDWHNEQRRLAALRARKAARPPCEACGKPVPGERRSNAIYCSRDCKQLAMRSGSAKARRDQQDANRMRLHGVSRERFDSLLAAQGGGCGICGTSVWPGKGPHLDHDHKSGAARGVLCHDCNIGLGHFKDDPDRLRAALRYLGVVAAP